MEKELFHATGTDVFFHTGLEMSIHTEGRRLRGGQFGPTRTVKEESAAGLSEVAFWGPNNDWPQVVIDEINKSDLLRPLIRKQAKRMIGQGVCYGLAEVDEKSGDERLRAMRVPEIDRHLKRTEFNMWCYKAWIDLLTHGNIYPELQMSFDNLVAGVFRQDPARCRLNRKTKENNYTVGTCFIGGNWHNGGGVHSPGTFPLPALDPDYDVAGQILNSKSARYILPLRVLVDDDDYYGRSQWHGLIEGGYLELAKAIIQFKRYLVKNMSTIRYHIEIASEFWPLFFGQDKWEKITDHKERSKMKQKVVDGFTEWVTGLDKTNRTLMTEKIRAELDNKTEYLSLWTIHPLKLDIPTGAYIEDSAEVDAKIIRAIMDQSLFGATPSKDRNSAGSGSDKRVAHTIELMDNVIESQLVLTPAYVMSEVNGWNDKYGNGELIRWWFRGLEIPTLDQGTKTREVA